MSEYVSVSPKTACEDVDYHACDPSTAKVSKVVATKAHFECVAPSQA